MGKYIFAPIILNGNSSDNLRKCIEYIGSLQNSGGSNLAKGIRYLKSTVGCSNYSIKYLYKSTRKYYGHNFDVYGPDVYKYDDKTVAHILETIINFVEMHSSDVIKKSIFNEASRPALYTDLLYNRQILSLRWVADHNYKDQQDRAHALLDALNQISAVLH